MVEMLNEVLQHAFTETQRFNFSGIAFQPRFNAVVSNLTTEKNVGISKATHLFSYV